MEDVNANIIYFVFSKAFDRLSDYHFQTKIKIKISVFLKKE